MGSFRRPIRFVDSLSNERTNIESDFLKNFSSSNERKGKMDSTNGKSLSPWKVPSKISLKRIRHKINSDLSVQTSSSTQEKSSVTQNGKRSRLMLNKFALARSISTATSDENLLPNENSLNTEKNKANDEHLLARLHQIMPPPPPPPPSSSSSVILSNEMHFNSNTKTLLFDHQIIDQNQSTKSSNELISTFPVDWSLKCSCRFSSPISTSFLSNLMKLRSVDESLALDYICSSTSTENDKAYFRSLTSYWIYPHLPWLRLFPRSQQQQQISNSNPLDEQAQQSLQDEWKFSFQSLYQAFRSKYCSFFYLCTHTFNILFREDSSSQILAIINPTTTGLRSTLEREGIEFTMADGGDLLNNSSNKISENEIEKEKDENDDDDEENSDENDRTCEQWLEDMGLSASTSTSGGNSNDRRNISSKKKISEGKSRSTTILIRDFSSVNSLFNFLLNKSERICIPLTGLLTGIPPTLISPRPFLYSTLKYLNVHFQSNSMLIIDGGPLLPDRLKHLWNLFEKKCQQIEMICVNVERTSAFNFDQQSTRTIKQIQSNENGSLAVQFTQV